MLRFVDEGVVSPTQTVSTDVEKEYPLLSYRFMMNTEQSNSEKGTGEAEFVSI